VFNCAGDTPAVTDEITSSRQLLSSLLAVRRAAVEYEERLAAELEGLDAEQRLSAVNLLHYLAIRQFDLRAEQRALSRRGLSSLGRSEPHVLATLDATIKRLVADLGATDQIRHALPGDLGHRGPTAELGDELLSRRAAAALGPAGGGRMTRVMVTLPTEGATDGDLVDAMVAAGMGIARINAAHDDRQAWQAMAAQVLEAARKHGRPVRIAVDLPGPKLRVGPLPAGPAVVRARPFHDALGAVDLPGSHGCDRRPGTRAPGRDRPGRRWSR
jgi:pyruvate kinase